MTAASDRLAEFLEGRIEPKGFTHREHVRVAHAMLRAEGFLCVLPKYARALQEITRRAGKPEAYHETVTTAFLSIIAERVARSDAQPFDAFADANPDLFDRQVLLRHYARARLDDPIARRTFLLPQAG